MKGPTYTLAKNRLMILFNWLMETGYDKNLQVTAPLLGGIPLFRFHLGEAGVRVSDFVRSGEYRGRCSAVVNKLPGKAKREIPAFDDLRSTLYQSGILMPLGLEPLEEVLSSLRTQDLLTGGDVYYIALDTNLLRDRFYSVYLKNIPPHRNLDFVLCETVRSELKNRRDKMDRDLFRSPFFDKAGMPAGCFINQNSLGDRLRYIGFLEYNRMRSATSCEEIDAASHRSGRLNDQHILEAYSGFVDLGRKVIFISRDNEAVRMMKGEENVIPILVEQRSGTPGGFDATWENFFELLYLLGVIFGRVLLMVGGVETAAFDGVWRRKDVEEWEQDLLRLVVPSPGRGDAGEMEDYVILGQRLKHGLSALDRLEDKGLL